METVIDGNITIHKAGPAGFGNNIYLVVDNVSEVAAFIDAPDEVEQSYAVVEAVGIEPSYILLTHSLIQFFLFQFSLQLVFLLRRVMLLA